MTQQNNFTIISNGWGVQTFTLSAMAALGVIEKPDAIVHADTTHESVLTYEFSKRWTPWLESRGLKIVTVCDENAAGKLMDESIQTFIPAFTVREGFEKVYDYNENDEPIDTGKTKWVRKEGQALRQCTERWKIAPVRRNSHIESLLLAAWHSGRFFH